MNKSATKKPPQKTQDPNNPNSNPNKNAHSIITKNSQTMPTSLKSNCKFSCDQNSLCGSTKKSVPKTPGIIAEIVSPNREVSRKRASWGFLSSSLFLGEECYVFPLYYLHQKQIPLGNDGL